MISFFVAVIFSFAPAIGHLTGGAIGAQTAQAITTVEVDGVIYSLGSDQSWGDYAMADAYTGSSHSLVIQDEIQYGGKTYYVREISAEAFADYFTETEITSVTLPDTLWYIEELAFYGAGFQEIVIPEGVKRIENSAFSHCQNLTSITLPSTLFEIGSYCFFDCRNLSEITSYIPSIPAQYGIPLTLGDYIFGCWYNDDDEIVWADPASLTVYAYGGPLIEDYAKEHGFGIVYLDEPVKEIRMTTSGNLTPKFGQTVTVPDISIASTDEHAKGKLDVTAEWYSSDGYEIPNHSTVNTNAVCLDVTVTSANVKNFDFSETKLYLNGVELSVLDHESRWVTAKYGDIDTGAYKIQLEAVGKGNSFGKISKDNSNFSSKLTMFAAQGSNVTVYAQANAGSEFIEWRKDDPNTGTVAGTNTTLTVPASNSTYYAIFGKALPASGNLGSNAKYTYDSATGTVTISPVGWTEGQEGISMSVTETPFIGTQKIKRVIIENGIGILSEGLFIDEDKIQRVDLPATLRSAGTGNASLDSRYQSAFARCRLVGTGFVVDEANPYLKAINGSLFNEDATIMYTYFGRTGVTEFTVPDTVKVIAWTCFEDFELDKLTLQGNGLRLQDYAIYAGTVGQLQINEGVSDLGDYGSLEGHVSVTLPSSLEKIGSQNGIVNASSLKNIDVASGSTHFKGIDGVLYKIKDDGKLALYKYPVGKEDKNFTTPANATEIMGLAIRNVKALKNVTLSGDMNTVRYNAFTLRNDLTLTVENPGCAFETLCIDNPSFNVTLRAAEGSLAHEYYTNYYSDNTRWSFEATETSDTPLQRPKNFRWDGDTLSWAAVTGANSYKVDVFTRDAKGNESQINTESITVSDPSFTYELTGDNRYWYKNSKYWCKVTAYGAGYQPSEAAKSPERSGNMFTVTDLEASITGDLLNIVPYHDPYFDEHETDFFYLFSIYDENDNCVVDNRPIPSNESDNYDLRGIAVTYSLPVKKEYRIVVGAYVSMQGHLHVPISYTKELTWYYGEKYIADCTFPDPVPDQTYTGKELKPAIDIYDGETKLVEGTDYSIEYTNNKNVGEATVTVTGLGDYGSAKVLNFKVVPKGPSKQYSLKRYKKALKVRWKRQSTKMSKYRVTGYEIQLATDPEFTMDVKNVKVKGYKATSKKVKKLKGKTRYYVRVRTYRTISGVDYCSPWTGVRNAKTK